MKSLSEGQTVIFTTITGNGPKHEVGVVVKRFKHNKRTLYDVLLESRSAICAVTTANSSKSYINRELTEKLCDSGQIITTIPYTHLVDNNLLPDTRA